MGLCNYYRKFIKGFANLAKPLTDLTKKGIKFEWTPQVQAAFELLKSKLTCAPCLKMFERKLKTRVVCDASDSCCGGMLEQLYPADEQRHPCQFFSKKLTAPE